MADVRREVSNTETASAPNDGAVLVAALGVVSATAVIAAVALLLAMLGQFMPLLALLLATPLIVAAARLARHTVEGSLGIDRWAAAACGLAVVFFAWNAANGAAQVIADRGATATATTAAWIFHEGDVRVVTRSEILRSVPGLASADPASEPIAPGTLEVTVGHGSAALLAVGVGLVGPGHTDVLTAAAGALGLLCFQLAVRRVARKPVLSLAAMVAVGVSFPIMFTSRDAIGPALAFATTWATIAVATSRPAPRQSGPHAALIGLLLGGMALLGGRPLPAMAALAAVLTAFHFMGEPRRSRLACTAAAAPLLLVTIADLAKFAGTDLAREARALGAVAALGAVTWAVVEVVIGGRTQRQRVVPPWVGAVVAASIVGIALAARLDRFVGVLPVALAGCAVVAGQRSRSNGVIATGLVAGLAAGWGLEVLRDADRIGSRPSFGDVVPFVTPATITLAIVTIDRLLGWASRQESIRRSRTALGATGVAVVGAVISVAIVTWPLRDAAQDRGLAQRFDRLCDTIGRETVVVVFGQPDLAPALRGRCDADVALADPTDARATVVALRGAFGPTCQRVLVLTTDESTGGGIADLVTPVVELAAVSHTSIDTGEALPTRFVPRALTMELQRVRMPAACTPTTASSEAG